MDTEDDKVFAKGFNHAYLINKHEPELAKSLTNGLKSNGTYEQGFVAGHQEYEKNRAKELAQNRLDELKKVRDRGDKLKERDK